MFKKLILLFGIFVAFALLINSCSIYQQGVELTTFSKCNFTVQNIRVINVAGIDVSNVHKINDLPLNDYLTLAKQAFAKNVPSKLQIIIKAYNPNSKKAAISGLDWELYLKADLYTKGSVDKPVEVLQNQSVTFDVLADINLMEIIHSKSLPQLLALVIEKSDGLDLSDLDAVVRIKPWYISGESVKKYPGFIKIKL